MHKPKKKIFRSKVNYSKEEITGRVALGMSGISMPMLSEEALQEYRKDFSRQRDSLNFGMLGNDPQYYERSTVADIVPRPEDYLEVPFRLISATVVGGGSWKATDFSDVKVLKKSTPLLDGVPLYKDHETDLNNWSGLVNGVKWTKAFTQDDGIDVPAGIDGIVAIDKVVDPKLARGVISGAIYSNSVTVEFDWEMSHTFENEWDFLNKLGTIGSDGKMIRRMVKTIHNYHESSLVWLGADPFAKAIDANGNHKNIDISSVFNYAKQSFGKMSKINVEDNDAMPEDAETARSLCVNFALSENVLSLARRSKNNFKTNTKDMDKFIVAFIAAFGGQFNLKVGDKPTPEEMINYTKQLSFVAPEQTRTTKDGLAQLAIVKGKALEVFKAEDEANKDATTVDLGGFIADHTFVSLEAIPNLEAEIVTLKDDKKSLDTKVTSLSADAEIGKKYIGMKRSEAVRLYKVAVGTENVVASVVAMFEKAGNEEVEGLLKQYTKTATHKFAGSCADCNSENFNFRSSFTGEEKPETVEQIALTTEDIYAKHSGSSMSIGRAVRGKE